jgi:hypothetical protein
VNLTNRPPTGAALTYPPTTYAGRKSTRTCRRFSRSSVRALFARSSVYRRSAGSSEFGAHPAHAMALPNSARLYSRHPPGGAESQHAKVYTRSCRRENVIKIRSGKEEWTRVRCRPDRARRHPWTPDEPGSFRAEGPTELLTLSLLARNRLSCFA